MIGASVTSTFKGFLAASALTLGGFAVGGLLAGAAYADGSAELNKLLNSKGLSETQTVLIERLSDGKVLFDKSSDQLVAPASVTKIVTSAAALVKLTPAYTFRTPFYYSGLRKGDKVTGDLIVVGSGDPFIISEKLWQLAADIRNLGIKEFGGGIVIDNSLFDDESRDESRQSGAKSSHNAYDAPVSPFGVNFNTFAVAISPGDKAGKPAVVGLDPYPLRGVSIENDVKTAAKGKRLQVSRVGDGKTNEKLVATGTIPTDGLIAKLYRSVGDPLQFSGEYLRAFLKAEGVTVRGDVRAGKLPADSTLLLTMDGYEMRRVVSGLNTFSNNYIADMLVKRLGAAYPRKGEADAPGSGSFANGVAVLTDFLRKDVGIKSDFTLNNGSGLATENRLSARQVVDVLAYMEKRMDVFPEFLGSLPAIGWDGTLKKRFGHNDADDLKGQFRAKSGTLTEPVSVSALAGYFRHPKHGLVAFCILENGTEGEAQPAIQDLRDRQDQLLVAFMNDL